MRVVFLYTNQGSGDVAWNPNAVSQNHFLGEHGLETEGYFQMLIALKDRGVIDDLIVFVESARYPGHKVISGVKCYVVPLIKYVEDFLQKDDVIFVRGGFRGWYDPFLLRMKKQKRWLILYAANTGRQRWPIWDIVLTDLNTDYSCDKRGRFWCLFQKPINPNIFYEMNIERDIDVCIGASKIHDKKAQWKVVDALIEYKKMFGRNLKYIMPGALRYRGKETPNIVPKINQHGLNVEQPGFVTRYELNKIYNRSKLFVYLGNSGENDRGPLEATSVGCPTLLGGTSRHAPFLRNNNIGIVISKDANNVKTVACEIEEMLHRHDEGLRQYVASYFEEHNGFGSVVIPNMTRLFNCIRANPIPNVEVLKKEYLSSA